MKKKVIAAAAAAVVALNAIAAFDETNVVSQVARKAVEVISKVVAFLFGVA